MPELSSLFCVALRASCVRFRLPVSLPGSGQLSLSHKRQHSVGWSTERLGPARHEGFFCGASRNLTTTRLRGRGPSRKESPSRVHRQNFKRVFAVQSAFDMFYPVTVPTWELTSLWDVSTCHCIVICTHQHKSLKSLKQHIHIYIHFWYRCTHAKWVC